VFLASTPSGAKIGSAKNEEKIPEELAGEVDLPTGARIERTMTE
jgi:hypothetical protein